jgi:hypothetical protein
MEDPYRCVGCAELSGQDRSVNGQRVDWGAINGPFATRHR